MKFYRNAIILVIVVALMVGAYFLITNIPKPDDTEKTAEVEKLIDCSSDDVVQAILVNSDGTFVIDKKDTDWVISSPSDLKADSSKLSTLVLNSVEITVEKVIEENAKDLTLYGLDKPVQLTLKLKDNTEKTILIGNLTPTKAGYYAKMKDSNKVCVISTYTAEAINIKRLEIKDKTLYTLTTDDIISFSMDRKAENVFQAKKNGDSDWQMVAPIQGNMNTTALSPMLEAIVGTTNSEYVEENPTDLSKYGLDNPKYVFEFATSTAKYKLMLGNEVEKGSTIYARLDGNNDVFIISESSYTFLDKPLKEIIEVFAYIVNIDQVNKIELTMDGQTSVFGVETYKDSEGNTDTDKDKFTLNGKDATVKDKDDKQLFRTFYQALIGISLDQIEVGTVTMGTPEVTIKYYIKSSPGTVKVDFVSKDADYYYVFKDGKYTGMLVKKSKDEFGIKGMKESLKTLSDAVNAQK